ncbi:MAG: spore coat associated protein CotJA [Ruminococcaceae bacterium]|jgi:hypothetical protein|nr:spore coat associated protein CotJA [Oscillospiraceae bacterium]
MERRAYDLTRILRDNIPCDDCGRNPNNSDTMVPECINTEFCVDSPKGCNEDVLTMAFINMQPLESVYPNETAFSSGTLFPNIDKPFYGGMRK